MQSQNDFSRAAPRISAQNYRRVRATRRAYACMYPPVSTLHRASCLLFLRLPLVFLSFPFPFFLPFSFSFSFGGLFHANVRLAGTLATGADNCVTLQSMRVPERNIPLSRVRLIFVTLNGEERAAADDKRSRTYAVLLMDVGAGCEPLSYQTVLFYRCSF